MIKTISLLPPIGAHVWLESLILAIALLREQTLLGTGHPSGRCLANPGTQLWNADLEWHGSLVNCIHAMWQHYGDDPPA